MRSRVPSGSNCEQPAGNSGTDRDDWDDGDDATDGAGLKTTDGADVLGVMITLGVGVGVWIVGDPTVQPLNAAPPATVAATITALSCGRPIGARISAG